MLATQILRYALSSFGYTVSSRGTDGRGFVRGTKDDGIFCGIGASLLWMSFNFIFERTSNRQLGRERRDKARQFTFDVHYV